MTSSGQLEPVIFRAFPLDIDSLPVRIHDDLAARIAHIQQRGIGARSDHMMVGIYNIVVEPVRCRENKGGRIRFLHHVNGGHSLE